MRMVFCYFIVYKITTKQLRWNGK